MQVGALFGGPSLHGLNRLCAPPLWRAQAKSRRAAIDEGPLGYAPKPHWFEESRTIAATAAASSVEV